VKVTVVPEIEQPVPPWLRIDKVIVPPPEETATALTELPKATVIVWLGGGPMPFVNVMTGFALFTVIVKFDDPVL
jgi:hypothetical protein